MKRYTSFIIFICALFGFTQEKTFTINWEGSVALENEFGQIEVPKFDQEHFNYDAERKFAQVTTASLLLEDSEYIFNGGLNLEDTNIYIYIIYHIT